MESSKSGERSTRVPLPVIRESMLRATAGVNAPVLSPRVRESLSSVTSGVGRSFLSTVRLFLIEAQVYAIVAPRTTRHFRRRIQLISFVGREDAAPGQAVSRHPYGHHHQHTAPPGPPRRSRRRQEQRPVSRPRCEVDDVVLFSSWRLRSAPLGGNHTTLPGIPHSSRPRNGSARSQGRFWRGRCWN